MSEWQMVTLIGADRPGIVALVSDALFRAGGSLGEASMLRLGANFTIMLMVSGSATANLETALAPIAKEWGLRLHIDPIAGGLHQHVLPNLQVRVHGADRPGIVAQVTGILARYGCNILELASDVAGDVAVPVYIMNIQGYCAAPLEDLEQALSTLAEQGINVDLGAIETLIG